MQTRGKLVGAALAVCLGAALAAQAYERELNSYDIREAFFLGKDTTFRSTNFLKDYAQTFPIPKQGVHVARIAIATPFRQVVDRAQQAPDGYNPLQAESDYRRLPSRLTVEVTLLLTPSFPAHTPYTIPAYGPIYFRDQNFWKDFDIKLVQQGEVTPVGRRGQPLYNCSPEAGCWLTGAVVTLEFDPDQVASRSTRILVQGPDGQRVEAEFDLARLR